MSRSKAPEFMKKFLFYYQEIPAPYNRAQSEKFFIIIKHISESFNNLSYKGQNDESIRYEFKCTEDIKVFINNDLKLSANHAKWAWFVKGLLLAHKEYTWDKYIKKNPNITVYKYFRTLLYHMWFWRGQIPSEKCIPIITNYVN